MVDAGAFTRGGARCKQVSDLKDELFRSSPSSDRSALYETRHTLVRT